MSFYSNRPPKQNPILDAGSQLLLDRIRLSPLSLADLIIRARGRKGDDVSWSNPVKCPICGHGDRWCSESSDTGAVVCMRVASDRPTANGGWLHLPDGTSSKYVGYVGAKVTTIDTRPGRSDIGEIANAYRDAAWPGMVEALAAKLGVSAESLDRLRIGWAFDQVSRKESPDVFDAGNIARLCGCRTFSFPLLNAAGKVVGIRLRREDAQKWSVAGGREGLFIPDDLPDGNLLICEGPTDTAAMLDLGFSVIGRPSCSGAVRQTVDLARGRNVAILADGDLVGRFGADRLARVLRLHCRDVRVIEPPAGIKDARAWRNAGATAADVQDAIDAAPSRSVRVEVSNV